MVRMVGMLKGVSVIKEDGIKSTDMARGMVEVLLKTGTVDSVTLYSVMNDIPYIIETITPGGTLTYRHF